MREGLKIAGVQDVDSTKVGMWMPEIGDVVIVPTHFPDSVYVLTTRRGHFARSERWGGEEFEVFPERTPEMAWQAWKENQ